MKRIIILFFLCCTIPLIAQHTDPIQEAMANYDYETALSLIAQKKTTPPLLLQKGKALRGLGLTTEALATYQEIICIVPFPCWLSTLQSPCMSLHNSLTIVMPSPVPSCPSTV